MEVRAILDPGSQTSYVTTRLREKLSLRRMRSECMIIKTFGSDKEDRKTCDVVELGILTRSGTPQRLSVVVVPHICDPVHTQPISAAKEMYEHVSGLDLADSGEATGKLEIDVLIGSDQYWGLVTGRVTKGSGGPTAIETLFGWVLSGPVERVAPEETIVSFVSTHSTHTLRVDAVDEEESLETGLRRFWELESLGILKNERSVQESFTQQIAMNEGRYEVRLPWKESHSPLPDNYDLCRKRLARLLQKLNQDPKLLHEYDTVIRDQLHRGIVEVVPESAEPVDGRVHYTFHTTLWSAQISKLRNCGWYMMPQPR